MSAQSNEPPLPNDPSRRTTLIVAVVVTLVIGVLIGLGVGGEWGDDAQPLEAGVLTDPEAAAGPDPFEVYEEARADRTPIYILFHSGGCPPCVEAEERATRILPDYEGEIVYVSAHTVDPRTRELFDLFSFRSVPTMFFVDADGEVVDQNIGPLDDDELRDRLDDLASGS